MTIGLLAILSLMSCEKNQHATLSESLKPHLPELSYDYKAENQKINELRLPDFAVINSISTGFQSTNTVNPQAPIKFKVENNEAATLGRVLFYDAQLSKNNAIACASCHQQSKAFADGTDLSQGFGGKITARNSMAFSNLATNNNFFWDSRQSLMQDLVQEPVTNHIEMGMEDMASLVEKLQNISYYPELFEKAYGSSYIDEDRFAHALSEFIASISSTNSVFDRAVESDFEEFSSIQKLGMAIFFSDKAKCGSCHAGANFSASDGSSGEYASSAGTANIGLEMNYSDNGIREGQFKIPSLRNIALTAPYMHDGRFETLRDVLNFYNENIQAHENLDDKLVQGGNPIKIQLNSLELDALEAFLHTLTDVEMTSNPMYSNPFIR